MNRNPNGPRCRHCKVNKQHRPRGLCWTCYYDLDIRNLYPSTSKFARRGIGHGWKVPKPTKELPNTPGKVLVMIERCRKGQQLFHPEDA